MCLITIIIVTLLRCTRESSGPGHFQQREIASELFNITQKLFKKNRSVTGPSKQITTYLYITLYNRILRATHNVYHSIIFDYSRV